MKLFISSLLLCFFWLLLTAELSLGNFLVGFSVGYLALWVSFRNRAGRGHRVRPLPLLSLAGYFAKEVVRSGLGVAYDVVRLGSRVSPGIISVKVESDTELEIVLLSNLITLTPGSLVLDYDEGRKLIYIHLLNMKAEDRSRASIDDMKRRVHRCFTERRKVGTVT